MRILIPGASGFIGQQLLEVLKQNGYSIFPTSRTSKKGFIELNPFRHDQATQLIQEISPHVVINLSWNARNPDYFTNLENESSLSWNQALFSILAKSSVEKVISIGSSIESKTDYLGRRNFPEKSSTKDYRETKIEARKSFVRHLENSDKQHIWLRVFQVYGPGQEAWRFIPSIINATKQHVTFGCKNPYAVRDWIHVEDVANSIRSLIEEAYESTIEIGTGIGMRNVDICKYLESKFGLKWLVSPFAPMGDDDYLVASSKAILFKYYRPQRNLFEYLDRALS